MRRALGSGVFGRRKEYENFQIFFDVDETVRLVRSNEEQIAR